MNFSMKKEEAREVLTKYLKGWKLGKFDKMYSVCTLTFTERHKEAIELKIIFGKKLPNYRVVNLVERSKVVTDALISTKIKGEEVRFTLRLVKEARPYFAHMDGEWGVNPISFKYVR